MVLDSGIDRSLVKHAIPDEAIDDAVDLGQQAGTWDGSCAWLSVTVDGDNPTLGIHADVQFLPALVLLLAVFLAVPFPLATDLQAATVNDQGDRSLRGPIDLPSDRHGGIASREGRMIGQGSVTSIRVKME